MTDEIVPTSATSTVDGPGSFSTVTRTRFADQAYATLFHKIVTGEIKEGDMLPSENELCALLGISRPVVRKALERLRSEGLIASRRGAGSFVQPRPPLNVSSDYVAEKRRLMLENLEFRSIIEPQAAYFAAQRRTDEDLEAIQTAVDQYEDGAVRHGGVCEHLDFSFHHAVALATHNRRFVDAIRTVEYDIDHGVNLVRYLVRFDHLERGRSVHADHARVLSEIRARKPDRAMAAMRTHLEHARVRMVDSQPKVA